MRGVGIGLLVALIPIVMLLAWRMQDGLFIPIPFENGSLESLRIGNVSLNVEVADTEAARTRGLSGRDPLPERRGLLLAFDELGAHGIWMKDMRFPIDIIWIAPFSGTSSSGGRDAYRIVDIKKNVQPGSFPEIFYPREVAQYVLEVNAGFVDVHGILIGDQVRF